MKKIFAILLSLALLVSLGVMTAAPVGAVTQPKISPTSATFNLDASPAQQVQATITWGSATTVTSVEKSDGTSLNGPGDPPANDWVVYGDELIIAPSYLGGLTGELTYIGDSVTLVVIFDVGICTLTITAVGSDGSVAPTSATWVFGSTSSVSTSIIWGLATGVTGITDSTGYTLVAADFNVLGTAPDDAILVITNTYLTTNKPLAGVGDVRTLVIDFTGGGIATFTITAVGPDPTISPTSAGWVLGSTDVVTTTITWNAATTLNKVKEAGVASPGGDLASPGQYVLIGDLVVIKSGWLSGKLATAGDTVAVELVFDVGSCLLTITATGANLPAISPASATYCVGACPCQNVTTIVNAVGVAAGIVSVVDVTGLSTPTTLTPMVDWSLTGNVLNIACGPTSTITSMWNGLECQLDCYLRGARLLEITFNDTCNTKVILTIAADCCLAPSLSSTALTYDLDKALSTSCLYDPSYAYAAAIVTFGAATNIAKITDDSCTANPTCSPLYPPALCASCNCTLMGGNVYAGADYYCAYYAPYASYLLFLYKATYLSVPCSGGPGGAGANLQDCGDDVTLTIYWAPANPPSTTCWSTLLPTYWEKFAPTKVTVTAVGTPGSVSPATAQFDIDNPANVTAMISWGPHATNITKITCGNCEAPPLRAGIDYTFDPYTVDPQTGCAEDSCLYIVEDWLTNKDKLRSGCLLEEVDDTIVLNIEFDKCDDAKLTIRAVGTPMCFIATAAGADAPQLDILREFRDEVMRPNRLGAELVSLYYKTSPPIAEFISQNEALKAAVRVGLIDPIVAILNWSQGLWS